VIGTRSRDGRREERRLSLVVDRIEDIAALVERKRAQ